MSSSSAGEDFVRLFAQHERRIYSYIFSLLGDWQAVDEVFQDTCAIMWAKFPTFQIGTDFAAWSCRIAHYRVLKYRQQCSRRLPFASDEFLATVAAARNSRSDADDVSLGSLSECMEKLSPKDREIIIRRYSVKCTVKELASELGVPANTAYKAVARIRRDLFDCVKKSVAREDHP